MHQLHQQGDLKIEINGPQHTLMEIIFLFIVKTKNLLGGMLKSRRKKYTISRICSERRRKRYKNRIRRLRKYTS